MSLRTRIFIVLSIGVLLILGISTALLIRQKKTASGQSGQLTSAGEVTIVDRGNFKPSDFSGSSVSREPRQTLPRVVDPLKIEQTGVVNLARIFIERYNTYSSDNDWQNIREVKSMVTVDLWNRLSGKISSSRSASFVGVTTEARSGSLEVWNESEATVAVQTTRTTKKDDRVDIVNQNFQVQFKKINGSWLVDKFAVQKN